MGYHRTFFVLAVIFGLLSPATLADSPAKSPEVKIAVPVDTVSASVWGEVIQGAPAVGMVVFNPSNGPGSSPDAGLSAYASRAQAAGIRVVGYVFTQYADGNVPISDAENQVDLYVRWYHVDGIFFDQANSSCAMRPSSYYATLYEYVKSKGGGLSVVLNPGTAPGPCYAPISDVLLNFENNFDTYASGYVNATWARQYPSREFYQVILGAPDDSAMRAAIETAIGRRAGWVYVTNQDASSPNPYGALPPYFGEEIAYVNSIDGNGIPLGVSPTAAIPVVLLALGLITYLVASKGSARSFSRDRREGKRSSKRR